MKHLLDYYKSFNLIKKCSQISAMYVYIRPICECKTYFSCQVTRNNYITLTSPTLHTYMTYYSVQAIDLLYYLFAWSLYS